MDLILRDSQRKCISEERPSEGLSEEVLSELIPEPSLQRFVGRKNNYCLSLKAQIALVSLRLVKAGIEPSHRAR